MMFTFLLIPQDGSEPREVIADSNHICEWEAKSRLNSLTALHENMRMTDLRIIAHIAAKRKGVFAGDLSEFIECHTIELKDKVRGLDQDELTQTIALVMLDSQEPERISSAVMDLLESLNTRADPTRPGR